MGEHRLFGGIGESPDAAHQALALRITLAPGAGRPIDRCLGVGNGVRLQRAELLVVHGVVDPRPHPPLDITAPNLDPLRLVVTLLAETLGPNAAHPTRSQAHRERVGFACVCGPGARDRADLTGPGRWRRGGRRRC